MPGQSNYQDAGSVELLEANGDVANAHDRDNTGKVDRKH